MSDLSKVNDSTWIKICSLDGLPADAGMAALLNENTPQEEQIALFKVVDRATHTSNIYAISNFDPFSQANVLARGILCSTLSDSEQSSPVLTVASPVLKQHFDLRSGQCVEDDDVLIKTYPSKVLDGQVFVQASAAGEPS